MISTSAGVIGQSVYACSRCTQLSCRENYNPLDPIVKIMHDKDMCYDCAYWHNLLTTPRANALIADHKYYTYMIEDPFCKPSTKPKLIMTIDKKVISYMSSFCYGTLPEVFWNEYPDTGHFLEYQTLRRYRKNKGFQCGRKGCWDRTHCFWYNGEMDWNEIPQSHNDGDEHCPSYLNVLMPNKKWKRVSQRFA